MVTDQLGPAPRLPAGLLVHHDNRAADGQRGEQIEHGEVEIERGYRERPVIRAESKPLDQVVDGVHHGAMPDLDALGLTC